MFFTLFYQNLVWLFFVVPEQLKDFFPKKHGRKNIEIIPVKESSKYAIMQFGAHSVANEEIDIKSIKIVAVEMKGFVKYHKIKH